MKPESRKDILDRLNDVPIVFPSVARHVFDEAVTLANAQEEIISEMKEAFVGISQVRDARIAMVLNYCESSIALADAPYGGGE